MTQPKTTRRRALTLIAAFAACPAAARTAPDTVDWRGNAMGAEVAIHLSGPRATIRAALAEARAEISRIENLFSLYDPESFLSRLNRTGTAQIDNPRIPSLFRACDLVWAATGGRFDPTVQPIWNARARGLPDPQTAGDWSHVAHKADHVSLAPGQALTFNGIAQGFATDRVTELLKRRGAGATLVNIGEYRALGGPFTLGLADPHHGQLATRTLHDNAVATSSPGALRFRDGGTHIIAADGRAPRWSTISVEAASATLADAASTAFCLMNREEIAQSLRQLPGIQRVTLVAPNGDLGTLT